MLRSKALHPAIRCPPRGRRLRRRACGRLAVPRLAARHLRLRLLHCSARLLQLPLQPLRLARLFLDQLLRAPRLRRLGLAHTLTLTLTLTLTYPYPYPYPYP